MSSEVILSNFQTVCHFLNGSRLMKDGIGTTGCFSVAFARSVPGGHLTESRRWKPLPQVLLRPKIVLLDSST